MFLFFLSMRIRLTLLKNLNNNKMLTIYAKIEHILKTILYVDICISSVMRFVWIGNMNSGENVC